MWKEILTISKHIYVYIGDKLVIVRVSATYYCAYTTVSSSGQWSGQL